MRTPLLICVLIALIGLSAAPAVAGDLKVGVVDIEYVILKSKQGKAAKRKLKKIFDQRQQDLNARQEKLLKLKKDLEAGKGTPEGRKKQLLEYQQGVVKLQEKFTRHQQELSTKETELMKPILKKLEKVLTAYAKEQGFDLILVRSQHGVVFAKPAYDVTEKILAAMNR